MKPGKRLESYVQYVYTRLLKLNNYDDVIVSTNVQIRGQSGAKHEFDVFYQFTHLNIECKVVIECKDWKDPISIAQVRDFDGKIKDVGIGRVLGVMVSKNGYQDGAETYAKSNGITLLTEEQLPTIGDLLMGAIDKAFLPNRKTIGQPFWTIMEVKNGQTTGNYYSFRTPDSSVPSIPFFYSKKLASSIHKSLEDTERYEVRGVSQEQLRMLIILMKQQPEDSSVVILHSPYIENELIKVRRDQISAEQLEEDYIY